MFFFEESDAITPEEDESSDDLLNSNKEVEGLYHIRRRSKQKERPPDQLDWKLSTTFFMAT